MFDIDQIHVKPFQYHLLGKKAKDVYLGLAHPNDWLNAFLDDAVSISGIVKQQVNAGENDFITQRRRKSLSSAINDSTA